MDRREALKLLKFKRDDGAIERSTPATRSRLTTASTATSTPHGTAPARAGSAANVTSHPHISSFSWSPVGLVLNPHQRVPDRLIREAYQWEPDRLVLDPDAWSRLRRLP
jgi:hypothetical protein